MPLSTGDKLGPYEIHSLLGKGGMGEVYRAHDPRMGRDVAIKLNSESFSDRFSREVHAVAAVNHSNVCHLYDVGPDYLVMELCDGETLAARLKRGKLTMEEALHYASQIADALSAAHAKGIVHRDLKPGNIMLTKSGLKVLDFGLAKIEHNITEDPDMETITAKGTILGTMQYMSPEQAQGKKVDARSDIFSFGLVLYEMITGKRAFDGSNPASIIAAILEREAPTLEPEGLNRLVKACLAKDPDARFQSARDLKRAIDWSASNSGEMPLPAAATSRPWLAWSLTAALAVSLAAVAFVRSNEKPTANAVPLHLQLASPVATDAPPLISPDGRKLAFRSGGRLWIQFLESGALRDFSDSEAGVPFWSPDSRFLGYISEGKLKRIDANGGPPQTVTELRSHYIWGGGAWNQDDVIIFGDRPIGLFRVPASGGVPVQITSLDSTRHENSHYCPSFFPDGKYFVYMRGSTNEGKSSIYLGSVDAKPEAQIASPLLASNSQPVYAPSTDPSTGYLLFVRESSLMAQAIDNSRFELKGQATPVAEQLSDSRPGAIFVNFSASANGAIVFRKFSISELMLSWYNRDGKMLGTVEESGRAVSPALSPDGTRLAVSKLTGGADSTNIWLVDLSRPGAGTRLTFGTLVDSSPVWSPDGNTIIFNSNRDGPYNLFQKPVNGAKEEELLLKSSEDKTPTSWSRDGRFLLYSTLHSKTKEDIWVLPMSGDPKPFPFLNTTFNETSASFSPDGRWVAYTSNESGQVEVYVRAFSLNSSRTALEPGGKLPISNGLGSAPHWRADGRELYYRGRDGRLMAVPISTNPAFRADAPQSLGLSVSAVWDSSADGKRFLGRASSSGPLLYNMIQNWQAGLKK